MHKTKREATDLSPVILGTGAAEGIPAAYCECEVCKNARANGGRDVRSRSCFYIDESNLVDYGPDLFLQCAENGISLRGIKNVFLTHFHDDHINAADFSARLSGNPGASGEMQLYGSKPALKLVKRIFRIFRDHNKLRPRNYYSSIRLNYLEPFKTYKLDGIEVTPILSSHPGYGFREWGYNYIFRTRGVTFLYAVDTGWYKDKTWNFLSGLGYGFDFVVMECTYGNYEMPDYNPEHLDLKNVYLMLDKMEEMKLLGRDTPVYLTHICHLHSLGHEDTQRQLDSSGRNIICGYDGCRIEI